MQRGRARGAQRSVTASVLPAPPTPANATKIAAIAIIHHSIKGERVRGVTGVGYDEEWDRQTEEQEDSSTPRSPSVRPREP